MARQKCLFAALLVVAFVLQLTNPCIPRRIPAPRYQFRSSPWPDYASPYDTTNTLHEPQFFYPPNFRQTDPVNLTSYIQEKYFFRPMPSKRLLTPAYMISPVSNQLLEVGNHLDGRPRTINERTPELQDPRNIGSCRTEQSSIVLTREETDLATGRAIRTCQGLIRVNKCDGSCGSIVKPSINSEQGLKKVSLRGLGDICDCGVLISYISQDCYCCNEGSFKVTRVKLDECYSANDPTRKIPSDLTNPSSYMVVAIEEPIDCRCRPCLS